MKNIIICISLFATNCFASNCPELYPNQTPIVIKGAKELCNSFYVVLFDNVNNRPILASERLLKGSNVGDIPRIGAFKTDARAPGQTTKPYVGSGYDKGHLVPADNGSTLEEVRETFLMSNMTPQNPVLNRGKWKSLEIKVRAIYNMSDTDVYVITLPTYSKKPLMLKDIPIPDGYWKIVYNEGKERNFYASNESVSLVKEVKSVVNINTLVK